MTFGCKPALGLARIGLPEEAEALIGTEEDLQKAIGEQKVMSDYESEANETVEETDEEEEAAGISEMVCLNFYLNY